MKKRRIGVVIALALTLFLSSTFSNVKAMELTNANGISSGIITILNNDGPGAE